MELNSGHRTGQNTIVAPQISIPALLKSPELLFKSISGTLCQVLLDDVAQTQPAKLLAL